MVANARASGRFGNSLCLWAHGNGTNGALLLPDRATLLISVQHPGEFGGTRRQDATQVVELAVMATDGTPFMQRRTVPIGSNWPEGHRNRPPRPGIVAIRREDLQPFC